MEQQVNKGQNEFRMHFGTVEIRKDDEGKDTRTISGIGTPYNSWSRTMGWFKERINERAFDEVDMTDVIASFNHNFDLIMARTTNTLSINSTTKGLEYSFEAPNTTAGDDLLENIRNGNVKGSSIMFRVSEDRWTFKSGADEIDEREILKASALIELGPVVNPAYTDTTAAARSMEETKLMYEAAKRKFEEENKGPEMVRKDISLDLRFDLVR